MYEIKNEYSLHEIQDAVFMEVQRDYAERPVRDVRLMCYMGLAEEAGEVVGIGKRVLRNFSKDAERIRVQHLIEELGDVIWYAVALANTYGLSLDTIWSENRKKLYGRYGDADK